MPQPFNNAVITNGGARLLTRAQAGELKIEFTKIAVGSGDYTEDEKTLAFLQSQTGLKSFRNSYAISDLEVHSDYSVKVTSLITNYNPLTGEVAVNQGYFINEMGLYAREKDGAADTEILYSIAVTSGDNGDFMPPYNGYNPAQIIQDYFVTVNNSSEVFIQTTGAVALAEDVMSIRKDVDQLKRNGAADGYSGEVEYHPGDYCIHEGTLYKCLQDTAGEWNSECWQKTSPMEEVANIRSEMNRQVSMIESLTKMLGMDQSGEPAWMMEGATELSAGKAGLVPAPGAGMQDAVLMGKGAWGKLGAAAMYNVANNDVTTEEGFLADARRVKALRDDFNALNSALENIGGGNIPSESYVYVIRTGSNTSFSALVVGTGVSGTTGTTLDVIHNDIGKYNTGLENISSGPYRAVLFKTSSSAYCGILMCNYMHEIKSYGLPVYFSYFNNGVSEAYSIFAPELCS